MTSIRGWIGKALLAGFGATALVACVAPQPDPYYAPGYYTYAPGYYAPPQSTFIFSYQERDRRHGHRHGHRHRW